MPEKRRAVKLVVLVPICDVEREAERAVIEWDEGSCASAYL
jgi:hypothetical protein